MKREEVVDEKCKEGFLRATDEDIRVALDMAVRTSLGIISDHRLGHGAVRIYSNKFSRGVYAVPPLVLLIDLRVAICKNPSSIN